MLSTDDGIPRARANSITRTTSGSVWTTGLTVAKAGGRVVGSHVFQHVRCRLKGRLTNLVHADSVPAIVARHQSAA